MLVNVTVPVSATDEILDAVNAYVNVGGGGGGGSGPKTIPIPFQLPSTIYDPSLITPNYGINDRQPTNPLTDAANDLMTPFIQSIISNQQKVSRIPISEGDVKPVNPINPKTPTQAIPIPQDDVKPVNPVIPPKPVEPYAPNPQTDQSRPIPPEIIMDSNVSSLIHNKHMDHKKNLQKQIQPQVPTTKPPKKIKDPEGLGRRIPIEKIGALAANIGAAALTGGATAAGEALVMGGAAGLMGAGESILGASIGAGVAGGVSTALGNTTTGHVLSSIAGGIAGRAAGRRMTNRVSNGEETQPLLSSRQGERLGGRRRRNRLVEPETQISRDPQTGETTSWQIPPEQSQPSLINRTVQSLRNRAQNLSDTVENIRQQITGRITNARRGRYARLATNEPIEQNEPAPSQSNEPPIIDVTNEIMPLLHSSATRIQRLNRAVRQRRRNIERQYQDQVSREFDENMTRSRNEELQRNQDAINELDQILRQDAQKQSSAIRIQNAIRNRKALNETISRAKQKSTQNTAAVTIQSAVRNKNAINETLSRARKKAAINETHENAATKISKVVRGHKVRKQLPEMIEDIDRQKIIDKINKVEQRANQMSDAAITIQKRFRQNKRKTTPITISNESPTSTIKPAELIADNVSRNVVKRSMNNIIKKQQTTAAARLQSAMRRRTDMMKKRQLVDEEQLKQMEETQRQIQAAKADKEKKEDIAAKQLQAISKRIKAQSDVSKIKQSKDKIGAAAKRLLTEKVKSAYIPKAKTTMIWNKNTVGQPLVVNKKLQLVSKKRHNAGVFGYETRQEYLDLADKYKDVMTKGKKKK